MKPIAMVEWERQCFGCTEEELRADTKDAISLVGPGMVAMSLLSDAQEHVANQMPDDARQTINRAKWIIRTYFISPPSDKEIMYDR